MKILKFIPCLTALLLSFSACTSSYRHNTIKVPSLDTNTVADISSDISPMHVNASACVKVDSHCHVLGAAYYSIPGTSRSWNNYHELGVGYHTKTAAKNYKGIYATLGYGQHTGKTFNGAIFFGARVSDIECSYARLSLTMYSKSGRRRTMRYYAALRSSLAYYIKYKDHYEWSEFLSSTSGYYESDDFAQIVFEPVFGMEKKVWKGLYLYTQSSLTWAPLATRVEINDGTFIMPQYTFFSMRVGIGYVWQKSVGKKS